MTQKEYYINYTRQMGAFLEAKKVNHFVTDSDIICIRVESWDDRPFVLLMLDFAEWLIEKNQDMSVNSEADGSRYHSGEAVIDLRKQFLN